MFTITITIEADDLVGLSEVLPQIIELAPTTVQISGLSDDASPVAATPQPCQAWTLDDVTDTVPNPRVIERRHVTPEGYVPNDVCHVAAHEWGDVAGGWEITDERHERCARCGIERFTKVAS